MRKSHNTNGDTSKMAMAKLYEVTVAVKVVVHAFDVEDAEQRASDKMQLHGWHVHSAVVQYTTSDVQYTTARRIKV